MLKSLERKKRFHLDIQVKDLGGSARKRIDERVGVAFYT